MNYLQAGVDRMHNFLLSGVLDVSLRPIQDGVLRSQQQNVRGHRCTVHHSVGENGGAARNIILRAVSHLRFI